VEPRADGHGDVHRRADARPEQRAHERSSIYVDDRPFFPTAVWAQCSDMFDSNINDGINLFMGDGCQDDTGLPARLAGRAYSIVDSENANATAEE
jgi:hypothetical protein